MVKKILFTSLAGCMMLAGCSKSDDNTELTPDTPTPPTETTKIPINVATGLWTRVTDTAFEQNDKVGIYVVNYNGEAAGTLGNSGNHVNNMRFTYTNNWTPDTPIYWKDQTTKADFYCYYPYSSTVADVTAIPFSVQTDQSSEKNYKASEFLWGKREKVAPTTNPVELTVSHAMSNLIIKLQPGQGYTNGDMERASVTIKGLKTNATINLATGVVTATGETANIVPKKESDNLRALVVPQNISNTKLIEVVIDGYTYSLTQSLTFESHKQHTCTLTVNRTNGGINIGVSGWETDDKDHGGTVN